MKHATRPTIEKLATLRERIGSLPELKEKKPGIFYRKSRAFLHFHEDGDRMYADVRLEDEFERLPCSTEQEQTKLLNAIQDVIQGS